MSSLVSTLPALAVSLLPVLVFLLALVLLDGYKLIRVSMVGVLVGSGVAVAGIAMVCNRALLANTDISIPTLSHYVAPILEETLKGSILWWLLRRNRIGFLVDAAICGFAVGAGFATVENIQYLLALGDPRLAIWILRGFGTAIMHGGATALFALVAKALADRFDSTAPWVALPGLLLAATFHSSYNHFFLSPAISTLLLLIVLPALFAGVFRASELATRRWLGVGFDTDSELLEVIQSGQVSGTRIGSYLAALKGRFAPERVVDMLCLIRLHLELSIKAKGMLIAREHGFDMKPDESVGAAFDELSYLERSVGTTGLLALSPIFNLSTRDLWQVYYLGRR